MTQTRTTILLATIRYGVVESRSCPRELCEPSRPELGGRSRMTPSGSRGLRLGRPRPRPAACGAGECSNGRGPGAPKPIATNVACVLRGPRSRFRELHGTPP